MRPSWQYDGRTPAWNRLWEKILAIPDVGIATDAEPRGADGGGVPVVGPEGIQNQRPTGAWIESTALCPSDAREAPSTSIAFGNWLGELGQWDLFATLTFNPNHPDNSVFLRSGFEHALPSVRRRVLAWHNKVTAIVGHPCAAVYVVEKQPSGLPHVHGLIDLGGLRSDGNAIGATWTHGIADVRAIRPEDLGRVARYCAKDFGSDFDRSDIILTRELSQLPPRGLSSGR